MILVIPRQRSTLALNPVPMQIDLQNINGITLEYLQHEPKVRQRAANHCGSKERGVKRGVFEVGARKEGFKISLYVVRRRRRRRAESALTASYRHTLAYRLKINVLLLRFHFSYVCMYVESGPFGRAGDRMSGPTPGTRGTGCLLEKAKIDEKSSLRL